MCVCVYDVCVCIRERERVWSIFVLPMLCEVSYCISHACNWSSVEFVNLLIRMSLRPWGKKNKINVAFVTKNPYKGTWATATLLQD